MLAGLTVALVALPQSMAYAMIAGVEPKHGIYALIVGCIIGSLFGSSRHLHTGPVNASSIVIAAAMMPFLHNENYMAIVFLLSFLAGLFQFSAGIFKFGIITQFISRSVLVGFTGGASVLIMINQLPVLLGLPKITSTSILDWLITIYQELNKIDVTALIIGLSTMLFILILNRLSPKSPHGVAYVPSSLLALLIAGTVVAFSGLADNGVAIIGNIPGNLPPLSLPDFDLNTIQLLATSALALTLISTSEAIASAKSIAALTGDKIQPNQELIGQGLAKMGVAFFSGMPISGSFTRSILNYRAGAQTRFASVFSGLILLISVVLFGPIIKYIPLAALAGVIMIIATKMISWKQVIVSFKSTKSDAIVLLSTFGATLVFHLDTAIYIGVGLSIILFLKKAQHPRLIELDYDEANGFQEMKPSDKRNIPEISIVHIEGDIFFGAADFLSNEIGKIISRKGLKVLILRMKSACCLDATSIMTLMQIIEYMKKQDKLLIISGVSGDVERIFRRSGLVKAIGEDNIFFSDIAVLKSTRKALWRALQYVDSKGEEKYRVRLFYDLPEKAQLSKKTGGK